MQADKIKYIVDKFDKLPYKCILFDGAWGIGKTYAIQKALNEKKNVCKISMFGLHDSQQIYHEILCQFTLFSSSASTINKINDIFDGISKVSDKVEKIKGLVNSFVNEKELFLALAKKFSSLHIIVIDDLERIGKNIELEEVLGIVEELKGCNYVKVILVANRKEMEDEKKNLLEKYNEKIIDRIYHITEKPDKVNWGDMKIDASFIGNFLENHKVKNLRTLQKAQNFFDDVKIYIEFIDNDYFKQEIRLICFAIVIESTDKLYYKEIDNTQTNKEKDIFQHLHNELNHRLMNYLMGIKSGNGLVSLLLKYYNNEVDLNENLIKAEYALYLKSGNKPNYYKTEEEIKQQLLIWEKEIETTNNLVELNSLVDEYVCYSDIVKKDASVVLKKYEDKLYNILWRMVSNGQDDIIDFSYDLYNLSSDNVKIKYREVRNEIRKKLVDAVVDCLLKSTSDKKTLEYSYKLRKYVEQGFYIELLRQNENKLYNTKFFPIDNMNENKYHTCYNIMYTLYKLDGEKFLRYCDNLSCDKMAVHRIKRLVEEIERG